MDKVFNLITEKYDEYTKNFDVAIKNASSVSEMLHVYASYAGRLQALLDAVTIESEVGHDTNK